MKFSPLFTEVNFYDFLSAFLHTNPLLKSGQFHKNLREPVRSFLLELDPFFRRETNNFVLLQAMWFRGMCLFKFSVGYGIICVQKVAKFKIPRIWCHISWCLIWVYNVCSGQSVPIIREYMAGEYLADISERQYFKLESDTCVQSLIF